MAFSPGDKALITREPGHGYDLVGPNESRAELTLRSFDAITPEMEIEMNVDQTVTEWPPGRDSGPLSRYNELSNPTGEGTGEATLYPYDDSFPEQGLDDMIKMKQLNDAELARNLLVKFKAKNGYVQCGTTLVALNMMAESPTTEFPGGPFDHGLFERFAEEGGDLPPHCWALAGQCYRNAFSALTATHTHYDQALIITGESGAGKTFITKKILDYLAWLGSDRGRNSALSSLTATMLSSTPILEGFGNSFMLRNPDSSRFGRLYQIYFDRSTRLITGCSIKPYMLEKSRVSTQQQGERNFHIFYRMLAAPTDVRELRRVTEPGGDAEQAVEAILTKCTVHPNGVSSAGQQKTFVKQGKSMVGLSPEKREMCRLGEPESYSDWVFLKGGSRMLGVDYDRLYTDVPSEGRYFEDALGMSELLASLHGFFSEDEVDTILKTTAGVLHLGNVEISGDTDECTGVVRTGVSGQALKTTADLWMVDEELLADACYKVTFSRGGDKTSQMPCPAHLGGREGAIGLRDAVARFVYERLFLWLVKSISKHLDANRNATGQDVSLGVLDIFGFEFYENAELEPKDSKIVNGLDQLNINTCNEMLQQQFVNVVFGVEKATYAQQGYPIDFSEYEDNSAACEFLAAEHGVMLTALKHPTTQRKFGSEGDALFLEKLKQLAGKDTVAKQRSDVSSQTVLLEYPTRGWSLAFDGLDGGQYGARGDKAEWKADVGAVNSCLEAHSAGVSPGFGIKHYAAEVAYDCRGWLEKDKSSPSEEMVVCLSQSAESRFMAPSFSADQDPTKAGVTAAFCASMHELLRTLSHCDMSFVRCIKTSSPLSCGSFQSALVLKQLRYTGMLDTLRIRRFGFGQRLTPGDFVDEFRILAPHIDVPPCPDNGLAVSEAETLRVAEAIASFLQGPYADSVFAALSPPEQQDLTRLDAKKAIVVGKPSNPQVRPLIMMRDWFYAGAQKAAVAKKAKAADMACACVLRKIFTREFAERRGTLKGLQPMLRALSERSAYLTLKRERLDSESKAKLYETFKAYSSRMKYAMQRNQRNECRVKQNLIRDMLATVKRQLYFESKIKFVEKELSLKENKRFAFLEEKSREYLEDKEAETLNQIRRCERMAEEEEHSQEVFDATQMAACNKEKEKAMLMASWNRSRAADWVLRLRESELDAETREMMLEQHKDVIEDALMRNCLQRFLAMGIISEESLLEKNWGSIIELKRLINNKHPKLTRLPADHDTQGLAAYFGARARHRSDVNAALFERAYAMFRNDSEMESAQGHQLRDMAHELAERLRKLGWDCIDAHEVQTALTPRSVCTKSIMSTYPDPTPRLPGQRGFGTQFLPGVQFNG